MDYLNLYLKRADELLKSLAMTPKLQPMALLSATKKVQEARMHAESELEELRLHANLACKKKNVRTAAPVATKRKRCGEMIGEEAGPGMSLADELGKMLSGLYIGEGMSVLDCIREGKGGAAMLEALGSMGVVVGKRLSTVIGEIFYHMAHGKELTTLWEAFDKRVRAEAAKKTNIFSRRVSNLLNVANRHILEHKTEGIIPELHDLIFTEALRDLIEKSSSAVMETESLLTLNKMPKTSILAGEKLMSVGESKIEECLDLIWDDLKNRDQKRSRHGD
ncbi:hypothetical protein ACLB2K_069790 [Fragaria x ananassa]